jgi:hypothetical protein
VLVFGGAPRGDGSGSRSLSLRNCSREYIPLEGIHSEDAFLPFVDETRFNHLESRSIAENGITPMPSGTLDR